MKGSQADSTPEMPGDESVGTDCHVQRFANWPGFDMLLNPINTDSPRACCDACKERQGCRVWQLNTGTQECYLKEDVGFPIPCADCVGGILDEDPFVHLNACRALGRDCANRAAQAACQEVRNSCSVPLSKARILKYPSALPHLEEYLTPGERMICKFYVRETCKWTAEEAAREVDDECHSLTIRHGPASLTPGCANRRQAYTMFRSVADAICESAI